MNTQQTLTQIKELKLIGMAKAFEAMLSLPVHDQPTLHQMMARLIEAEVQQRAMKKTDMFLKTSNMRYNAVLEQIHCSSARNFTKDQRMFFSDCSFIDRAENVLITGSTGCGKSYLACAIGRQACVQGYRVVYLGTTRFFERISQTKLDGTYIKWLNQLQKHDLIILDDFGLHPLNESARLTLLQLLEDRYEKKSVIVTSQLPVAAWFEYINEPTLADAIMDRMSAQAHRIELKGESKRKQLIHN